MIKTFHFLGESSLEFDDAKTVKELIQYAFEHFGYYEPFGMNTVTIYQSNYAHFTLDTSRKCREEIKDLNGLCFAYYIPGLLYYAEGGWGHHMLELPNHPEFSLPVSLKLKFDNFDHTVVFEGRRSFREVLKLLKRVGYIDESLKRIKIQVLAYPKPNYVKYIDCQNFILDAPMVEFYKTLPKDGVVTLILGGTDCA